MSGSENQGAGKLKEVAGKVTGDRELEAEGKTQHAGGKVEQAAENTGNTIKGAAKAVTGKEDA
ncbi:MAG TPA: CsbD family protein [Dehalococcoidia bacterium]|nr:CsbD family protein [Dehalococcoidia bacterium]